MHINVCTDYFWMATVPKISCLFRWMCLRPVSSHKGAGDPPPPPHQVIPASLVQIYIRVTISLVITDQKSWSKASQQLNAFLCEIYVRWVNFSFHVLRLIIKQLIFYSFIRGSGFVRMIFRIQIHKQPMNSDPGSDLV